MNATIELDSPGNQRYRIACYGYANRKTDGSLVGPNCLMLEEMLKRGFQIDFYGWRGFNEPQELFKYKNFQFIPVPNRSLARSTLNIFPDFLSKAIHPLINLLFIIPSDYQSMYQEILANHQKNNYDLLLFLGLPSPFKVKDIPIISWLQGSTLAEWFFIQKLRSVIISLCGIGLYIKLMFFYAVKGKRIREERKNSDLLICGSQWSKEQLISEGVKPGVIRVLSYPMNLDFFELKNPAIERNPDDRKVFLWLGRCDPRKRLDLLLDAYALVLKQRQDVQLKVFGSLRYAKGYKKLIDQFQLEFPNHLEYRSRIERCDVPELMANSDILIQPSEGENFGSSVAEALCCGLPVIVGPTNGTKDYINPSSFIFNAYDAESLKETMLQAIQAVEQDKEKLALESRQFAETNFSVSRIVDCLQDIFSEVLTLRQSSITNQPASLSRKFGE